MVASKFGQLGARQYNPDTARTEIYGQGGIRLDTDDPAEAIGIVRNLIQHGVLLRRRSDRWRTERTVGQVAPGHGVEPDTALAVDFGSRRVRIVLPCAKMTKL